MPALMLCMKRLRAEKRRNDKAWLGAITHPDDLQENLDKYNQLQEVRLTAIQCKRFIRPDGSIVWVDMIVRLNF